MKEIKDIGFGVSFVDARYIQEDVAVIYLLKQDDKVAIIETGTKYSFPYVESALKEQGLTFDNVVYIMPTHVHLDHSAGASGLMNVCKNAKLVIHPRGARHMIDPSKLVAGAIAVYGEETFKKLYDEIIAIDVARIIEAGDNFDLDLNGRILKFLDTPGHARHHFSIWDELGKFMFTGDTFGLSYRGLDVANEVFILPTTTPTQFNPDDMLASIDRIMSYKPEFICLTHFGNIKPTKRVIKQLKDSIYYISELAIECFKEDSLTAEEKIKEKMMSYFLQQLKDMGAKNIDFCKKLLQADVELNTQGLIYWQQQSNAAKT